MGGRVHMLPITLDLHGTDKAIANSLRTKKNTLYKAIFLPTFRLYSGSPSFYF